MKLRFIIVLHLTSISFYNMPGGSSIVLRELYKIYADIILLMLKIGNFVLFCWTDENF